MKTKWLGLIGAVPLLVACNSDIKLSSRVLSHDQINTVMAISVIARDLSLVLIVLFAGLTGYYDSSHQLKYRSESQYHY
jgi:hypothetical protein